MRLLTLSLYLLLIYFVMSFHCGVIPLILATKATKRRFQRATGRQNGSISLAPTIYSVAPKATYAPFHQSESPI